MREGGTELTFRMNQRFRHASARFSDLVRLLDGSNDQRTHGDAGLLSPLLQGVMQWFRNIDGCPNWHAIIMAEVT